MSLIKKIVEIVERTDNVDARKNITKLNADIKLHSDKVKQYIEANYVEFLPTVINNEGLLDEGKSIEVQLTQVKENLKNETANMYQANDEISKIVEELEESNMKLNLSLKLVKIDNYLGKIRQLNEFQNYSEINNILNKIQLIVNDPEDRIIRRLDMYKNLKLRLSIERANLLKNLENRFNSLVQMKEKSFLKTRAVTMNITKNGELVDCIDSIVEAGYDFKVVTDFIMNNIFTPIICRPVSLEILEYEKEFRLSLSYSTEPITDELRPNYTAVFFHIRQVLLFLLNVNVRMENNEYFMAHIFEDHRKELLELIFKECLIHSIPKTFEEKNQCTMNVDIDKLSGIFAELHFFPESAEGNNEKLEDYCQKMDELFYKQFTKSVQASASDILKRELHDMILISEDTTLSTNTPLTFPQSMISKSTLELIQLLEKILHQANACGEDSTDKRNNLIFSFKAVLENYPFTVQLHHSKFMSKIPQQSALFYNNCMYLSNWVTNSRETEHMGIDQVIDDLVKNGWEILECQIAKQKIQMMDILKTFDPSQSLNTINPEHFKPIRQCLRQMDLLKNVWQTILPTELYNKTMAGLLDVISLDLIKKVLMMEDISTTLGNTLVDLIKTVDEKGQSLFDADTSALAIVPSWQKMSHLQFILDASLVDITASWKAGQISQSIRAEDVKRLIRALFQNTDRRANALSAIA